MLLTKEDVQNFLPHTDPFLFIDEVESIQLKDRFLTRDDLLTLKEMVGAKILAHYDLSAELDLFRGHFPENPILPGVIQVEMMAQTACCTIAKTFENPSETNLEVALVATKNTKFRRPVVPPAKLRIEAECLKLRGKIMVFSCAIYNNNERVSEAEITASVDVKS